MYIATDLCNGPDLLIEIKRDNGFSEEKALEVILPVMEAVQHMHDQGYAHMDIKADNIMRDFTNQIVLLDFSCALSCTQK